MCKSNENYQEKWMKAAARLSLEQMRAGKGGPFGAVIVKDGKIIARGYNKVTSHNDPTAHAEITAIRRAAKKLNNFNLEGCEIYSSCEPCPMCLAAIYWARLDRVYYAQTQADAAKIGFDDAFLYREIALPMEKRTLFMSHQPEKIAAKAMQEWMDKEDKIEY